MRITRSTRLSVCGAAVWVTRSNDTEDYWLQPGDKLKLRERERLWLSVEGDRPAQVVFTIVPTRCDRAGDELARAAASNGWSTGSARAGGPFEV